ncbi:Gfo/Idh/MocA family protein [Amycolatopsis sp. YIM 10]|uniref:Gfo/Idh/MocA family protein n=1 Tax=Amycolatopsis sp. YIM 10 TaxID=2653857 RepID=UPI00128FF275|nr:Gfo/Idh/MocA family oxidoreductase [Amycolatopsis sp. YIM 10]QFU88684.1 Inositol 2-dehydrogenase [Amycolatopsis sp. YIM 10]
MNVPSVALVGLGEIGLGAHLPALLRHEGLRLAAVVDPDPARRALAAEHTAAPAFESLAEVLSDPVLDAVVLATPPWVTPGLVGRVAATGRFVLAEKPIAVSSAAAAPLAKLPAGQRKRVQVGLTYRHDPALAVLREWIDDGRLGDGLLVRAHIYDERRDPDLPEHARRIEATLAHGMPVVHEGAHVFDWFATLFGGPPERLEDSWAVSTRPDLPAANLCGARLTYPGGVTVLAEFGWLTDAQPRCEISVIGDRGHAQLDGFTFDLRLTTSTGVEHVVFDDDRATRCFDLQLARFTELITGVRAVPSPGLADGLAALEISERVAVLAAWSLA